MKKDHISVLMAVYNAEDTLREAIDSILAQTYTNWKFIICNDCSTDNSEEILQEYAKKYPEKFLIIHNEVNSRLAASLNHCLEYADGEFCARMDADDYVDSTRFEKQINYLRANPNISLVGTSMYGFDDKGLTKVISYKEHPTKFDLKDGPCFSHASIMMYTQVYHDIGGYIVSKRTMRSQDYDLWLRFFAKNYEGANITEPLYFVREDYNSFLRKKPKQYFWSVVTRFKGFKMLNYPVHYYIYAFRPILSFIKNELNKIKYKITEK